MTPVSRISIKIILALILLAALMPVFSARALAEDNPSLSETQAKQIATAYANIESVTAKHIELERHAAWNAQNRTWDVYWLNPENYRKVVDVIVDDAAAKVISVNIMPEVYGDILPRLSKDEAIDLAQSSQKVRDALTDKPDLDHNASIGDDRVWTVNFFSGNDTIAEVLVDDETGVINEVRIGPQIAWQMARGYSGAFGRIVNEPYIWLPLCLLFLAPFVDVRRPLRMLHLDLLVLLSFTVSHYYFNLGEIFSSVPLAYPPLVYLFLRLLYMAVRRPLNTVTGPPRKKLHLNFSAKIMFVALIALLAGRIVMNVSDSNVVDVGYSGVIGAHLIREGTAPYGNMPSDDSNGDTYGPLNYIVYMPFERLLTWSGSWDDLPAAHATAIFFDLLTVAGMYLAGRKLASGWDRDYARRFGLALAWAWAAYPYTTFVLNCNVNDSIVAAFLIWGFVFIDRSFIAGLMLGCATQIKFFPAMLAPLWASYPRAFRGWGRRFLFLAGFVVAVAVAMPVIFLGEGTFAVFWQRSIEWQLGRESPFSIWGQHADALAGAQRLGQYGLVAMAFLAYFWPARKNLIGLAAATAALIIGFQLLQTHWFYLYIPWFFPLAMVAFLGWSVRGRKGSGVAAYA